MENINKILNKFSNKEYVERTLENYIKSIDDGYIDNEYLENEIYNSIINNLEDIEELNLEEMKLLEQIAISARITINANVYQKKAMVLKIVSDKFY